MGSLNQLWEGKDIDSDKEIIKSYSSKEKNEENNNISNTSINSDYVETSLPVNNIPENFTGQLELVRKEKHGFSLKHRCSKYKSKEK